jgi:hypothetical protein
MFSIEMGASFFNVKENLLIMIRYGLDLAVSYRTSFSSIFRIKMNNNLFSFLLQEALWILLPENSNVSLMAVQCLAAMSSGCASR